MSAAPRVPLRTLLALATAFLLGTASPSLAEVDLGSPNALEVGPQTTDSGITLRGADARQQLLATGTFEGTALRDLTRDVTWSSNPQGIVRVTTDGLATPLADGTATVTATAKNGKQASLDITVTQYGEQIPINFANEITPVFTKLGCNGGGCHGKASGQNGFRLSLLGFYPEDDYEFLVKESRGRRIFPFAPERSLLLTKPVGESPHGGGKRMEKGSHEYRLITRWIEQGLPYGSEEDPHVVQIDCVPAGRVMQRDTEQQIVVLATYSDGSVEDVTRMSLFEPNDTEMAEVSETGLVHTLDLAGEVAVMARYQGQVSTYRATIPLGAEIAALPPKQNFIDEHVFNKLEVLGIPPSPVCDDATFLRRVHIDITGTTPTAQQVDEFLADTDSNKRAKVIDRLLDSPQYADYFANKWNSVLRNKKRRNEDTPETFLFHQWVRSSLAENKPYDEFVKQILTASGDSRNNPAVVWYREVDEVSEQVEDTAQLFLGTRIQCARCHHHPFEKWSQNDYYSLAAFFSGVKKKALPAHNTRVSEKRVYYDFTKATARNPRNGQNLPPAGLGAEPVDMQPGDDPRVDLADWMAEPDNKFFAPTLVNRYWKHFFSRGIVEPEDDMRETNPPTNPELLAALSKHFVDSGFDLKELVRTICNSSAYQLTSLPNDHNLKDKQNFSRYYPKRLTAEVLYDAFHQVTNTSQSYNGLPQGTSAVQLPDASLGPYFLKVFGQPQGDTACECERSQEANLAQSLHLLNSQEVQNKIASGGGRAAQFARDTRPDEEKIQELYRWAYSRPADPVEINIALAHVAKHEKDKKVAYEDLVWALINTKEFLFNH